MQSRWSKRALAMVLSLSMIFSSASISAWADENVLEEYLVEDTDEMMEEESSDTIQEESMVVSDEEEKDIIEDDVAEEESVGAGCSKGIYGNGTGGIYIDINNAPYTTYANKAGGSIAYQSDGCTWFAAARVNQLTGKDVTIWSGSNWYNSKYADYGFTRGETPAAPALACFGNHVAVIESINGSNIVISEGGMEKYLRQIGVANPYDYGCCVIRNQTFNGLMNSSGYGNFLGYVYLKSSNIISCYITPTLAKSSMKIGETCILRGNVSSSGAAISKVSAGIYTDKTGNNLVNGIYKENSVNGYSYNLSRIDNDIHFERITSGGTYYLVVKATLSNGKVYSNCASIVVNGNTCTSPSISFSDINGGKQVRISKSSSDTINYTIKKNGTVISSGNSSSNPFTMNLTEEGNYTVSAYASRSGYTNSGTANGSTNVSKAAQPEIVQSMTDTSLVLTMKSNTSGAVIYYTTDGKTPSTSSSRYTGSITLNESKTLKAIAIKDGFIKSDVTSMDITLAEPDAPTNLELSCEKKIAVGEAATIKWEGNVMASSYTVDLYCNDKKVDTYTTAGKTASFILEKAGTYSFKLYAGNFIGNSTECENDITVEAMNPLSVKFVDWDNQAISEQTIAYGHDASIPDDPSRRGYTFVSWDGVDKAKNVTEDIVIHATYKINVYSVRFYNASGKQIGSTQKVEYLKSASAPVDLLTDIPTGYTLAGWRVLESSNDSTGDYTKVDSDLKLQAVYCWENKDLPVVAEITSAKFDADTSNYKVDVKLTNYPDSATTAILRVSLKTATGKMVKSAKQEIDILADATVDKSVTLKYSGKVSTVSVVLLGVNGDDLTGSAYSREVTKKVSYLTDTTWTDWSEWSTEKINGTEDREVETVTEYRYKDKQTTTGSSSTMTGWTLYNTTSNWGSWGSWSGWSPSYQSGSDSKQVESRTEWRYYFFYCPVCGGREPYQGMSDCHKYTLTGGNWNEVWCAVPYNSVPSSTFSYTSAKRYTTAIDGKIWIFGASNINDSAPGTRDGGVGDPVIRTAYRYRTRSKVNTYHFYKWGDWSNWDKTAYTANDNRQVETRTLYRYRDKVEITDERAEKAEEEGIKHTISGNLTISTDLKNKLATVMVYKGKNTDPNEDQIQYVGQTEIGEGNSFDFDVIPKTEPNQLTGDFTICLGIEGSTGLINVGLIEAPKQKYTVKYLDSDGTELSVQNVSEGHNAVVPESPEKEGFVFLGWNANATNVQEDLVITAIYAPITYTVAFVDSINGVVSFGNYRYGEELVIPQSPSAEGRTFKGWDCVLNGETAVKKNMVVSAVYEANKYTVKFVDQNGTSISTQTVEYGKTAMPPAGIVADGKTFCGWDTSSEWWYVTKDITVRPILLYAETVNTPSYEIFESGNSSIVVYLTSSNEGADIYYAVSDNEIGKIKDVKKYEEPIILEDIPCSVEGNSDNPEELIYKYNTNIMAYSTCDGMNDSDCINITYEKQTTFEELSNQNELFFDGNGSDYLEFSTKTVKIGNQYGVLPIAEKEGDTFVGWYTEPKGGELVTSETIANSNGVTILYAHWASGGSENPSGIPVVSPLSGTISVIGKSGAVSADVTFDLAGCNDTEAPIYTMDGSGKKAVLTKNLIRKGYTFKGWFIKDSKTGKDKKISAINEKILTSSANLTVMAKWQENVYTVQFKIIKPDKNAKVVKNKDLKISNQKVLYESMEVNLYDSRYLSCEGYAFVGWTDDAAAKANPIGNYKLVTNTKKLAGDTKKNNKVVLYSVWKKN